MLFFVSISALVSFAVSLVVINVLIRLSHRFRWYDDPDHRKIHSGDIPRIGGLGIFLAFCSGIFTFFVLYLSAFKSIASERVLYFLPVFTALLFILLAGLADDFTSMRARHKFYLQFAAALLVTFFGFVFKEISLPGLNIAVPLGWFSYPFTIFWILGLTNALNLIDGLDGLSGGITAVASLTVGILSVIQRDFPMALFSLTIFASTTGFLVFNFPPAKIFMGDSGSLFLGFSLAVIPLLKRNDTASTHSLIVVFTMVFIPVLDTLEAIIRRTKNRIPVYHPDQNHLHHKLLRMGLTNKKILFLVYGLTVFSGASVILAVILNNAVSLVLVPGVWVLVIALFLVIDSKNRKKNGDNAPQIKDVHKNGNAEKV